MVDSNKRNSEVTRQDVLIAKLKEIQMGLKRTIADLKQNLAFFGTEQPSILENFEDLKRDAELRSNYLEAEVKLLREEVKYLKEFLGVKVENESLS